MTRILKASTWRILLCLNEAFSVQRNVSFYLEHPARFQVSRGTVPQTGTVLGGRSKIRPRLFYLLLERADGKTRLSSSTRPSRDKSDRVAINRNTRKSSAHSSTAVDSFPAIIIVCSLRPLLGTSSSISMSIVLSSAASSQEESRIVSSGCWPGPLFLAPSRSMSPIRCFNRPQKRAWLLLRRRAWSRDTHPFWLSLDLVSPSKVSVRSRIGALVPPALAWRLQRQDILFLGWSKGGQTLRSLSV